ncbi:NAD(P)/FAD-dependent oxidoreductase [Streptomyces sp. NPDC052396]|uniref:NAD(P)/FAD-dependent oxidoreductase n=1 Tax=Streptomyces sp. NPDC052396 TaxID=3365689 RepID=UPI0037D3739A
MPEGDKGHYDLAVIGTGIVGALTAYYAVRRDPGRRVLLLSQADRGAGATRLSAGFDTPTGRNAAQRALAARSTALFAALAAELPQVHRRPVEVCWLVGRDGVAALERSMVAGGPPRPVGRERRRALAGIFPNLAQGADQVLLASGPMTAGAPRALADLLLDRVLGHRGNALWQGFRVTGVRRAGGRLELTAADGARVTAGRVAVAPGPWALDGPVAAAARAHGARLKKVVAYHIMTPPPPHAPALVFEDQDAFLLPQPADGCWLLSITSPDWDRSPDQALVIDARDRAPARALLKRHVPGFLPHLAGGRVFPDCFTPGHLPLVATAGDPAVVMAVGGSGSGYRLAPAMAEDALDLLYGRTRT